MMPGMPPPPPPPKDPSLEERKDCYDRHSTLLVDADKAEDPVERMLIVSRLLFSFCCDILRTSDQISDIPIPTLGYHCIKRKELGQCPGGNLRLHLQEICTFSSKNQAAACNPKGTVRATMTIALRPWARTKGQLIGSNRSVEIRLEGGGVVQLDRYREEYTMTFPSLMVSMPLTEDAIADYIGQASIICVESGIEAKINFKSNHAVKGVVQQIPPKTSSILLQRSKVYHHLSGRWDKRITITNRNPEKPPLIEDEPGNLLYDAHKDQYSGCYINKRIDIGRLGPLQLPKLWSAFHDALMSIDPERCANTSNAKQLGVELKETLPLHYGLHFDQFEKKKHADDSDEEPGEERIDLRKRLPPCIEEQKEAGGRLHYQLSYSLVFLTPDEMEDVIPHPFMESEQDEEEEEEEEKEKEKQEDEKQVVEEITQMDSEPSTPVQEIAVH